jgi:hypothetical protein
MSRDPDNLYDDDVVAVLELKVRRNGAMSVAGCINEEAYALAMLDNARDTIKRHNTQNKLNAGASLIIPSYDTGIIIK